MLAMSKQEAELYARDGYIIRKGLLSAEEVQIFRDRARAQLEAESKAGAVMAKGDKEGKTTLLKMWNTAEDDQYGFLAATSAWSTSPRTPSASRSISTATR
jgi:hypothetical protein